MGYVLKLYLCYTSYSFDSFSFAVCDNSLLNILFSVAFYTASFTQLTTFLMQPLIIYSDAVIF